VTHRTTQLGLLAFLALATGCSSSQSAQVPGQTTVNVANYKAQLGVGVATFNNGTTGLNVVATFRQPDGFSGTLVNTPTITGPVGFLVPAGMDGSDGGTRHISGSPQVAPLSSPLPTTLGEQGGVFGYGLAPDNSTTSGALTNLVYDGAFYDTTGTLTGASMEPSAAAGSTPPPVEYRGGPPSYPNVLNGDYPSGFEGYTQGFTEFDTPPVAGSYTLSIVVPASSGAGTTITATPGRISSTTGAIGPIAATPTFVEDGNGGGTATCTVPATARETLVDLTDITQEQLFLTEGESVAAYYSKVVMGGGAITAVFAANLGAYAAGAYGPTINTGDEYNITCIAVNYPAYESGPPTNTQELPAIVGSNGQADISFSPNLDVAAYGGAAAGTGARKHNVEGRRKL
jgi:hypothetical protein